MEKPLARKLVNPPHVFSSTSFAFWRVPLGSWGSFGVFEGAWWLLNIALAPCKNSAALRYHRRCSTKPQQLRKILAALRYHWRCSTKPQQLQIILAAKAHTRSGHLYQATFLLKTQDKCEMFSPWKDSSLYTLPTNAAPSSAGVDGFLRGPWRSCEFLNIALAS
jgi:hypothetical protein